MSISPDKEKAVETAIGQIERQFGKGSIMKLGDSPVIKVPVIPTGSLALDVALGVGGLPRGRVTEVFGPEASGKTTLALHAVAEAQKKEGLTICAEIIAKVKDMQGLRGVHILSGGNELVVPELIAAAGL